MTTKTDRETGNKSASQRIDELEVAAGQLYSVSDLMIKDLTTLKNAVKLLNNKVSAIVEATKNGQPLTDETLDTIMIESNVRELESKVKEMVQSGIVTKEDAVSENSFVVGSESDESGKVINPRIQFALKALNKDFQDKLLGTKPGDSVSFGDNKLTFKLIETYKINDLTQQSTNEQNLATEEMATEQELTSENETTESSETQQTTT